MDVFEEQADYNGGSQNIDQNGTPVRIRITRVTPSFFRLLRTAAGARPHVFASRRASSATRRRSC